VTWGLGNRFGDEHPDELRNDPAIYQSLDIFIRLSEPMGQLNAHLQLIFHKRIALCPVTFQAINASLSGLGLTAT